VQQLQSLLEQAVNAHKSPLVLPRVQSQVSRSAHHHKSLVAAAVEHASAKAEGGFAVVQLDLKKSKKATFVWLVGRCLDLVRVGWLVGWLVRLGSLSLIGWLAGRLAGWLVGWSVGRLVGWLVS
jgi:hypothetical protein